MIADNTVSSGRHTRDSPTGVKLIVYTVYVYTLRNVSFSSWE